MGVFSRADHAFQKLNIGVKKSIGKDAGQRGWDVALFIKQELGVCGYLLGGYSWFSALALGKSFGGRGPVSGIDLWDVYKTKKPCRFLNKAF
jgi:hypothetical protein